MYLGKIKSSKTSARRSGLMPDYVIEDGYLVFSHELSDGSGVSVEMKLEEDSVPEDMINAFIATQEIFINV